MGDRRVLRRPLRAVAVAVGFLTRLPIASEPALAPARLVDGAVAFPLVGAALGMLVGGTAAGLALGLPPLLAATIAVALELAVTGALHVDGLADSADGLAGRDAGRALEIMRDHSLGAYGGSALTLDLVAKVVALAALAENGAVLPVAAAFAVSRAAPLPLAAALPYARDGGGTGGPIGEHAGKGVAVGAVALAAALALVATGVEALAGLACLALVVAAVGGLARRRLGGMTGDVMGAAVECTATLALIVAVAVEL